PRAFDHDERLQGFLRHVLDPEDAGERQVECKQHRAAQLGLAFELERDLVIVFGELADADIDLDIDRGLRLARRKGAGRIRIFEREVLDVLGEEGELRLRLGGGLWAGPGAASTGGRHERYLSPVTEMLLKVAALLTQGH